MGKSKQFFNLKMNKKATAIIFSSIVNIIGGMALNFQEFLMGSPATVKNLIVTLVYLVIWILILTTGTKSNSRGIIQYCNIFWGIMLFLSIVTVYVNATGASADWALPLAVLLLGQWYGINFFIEDFLTSSIIIAVISLAMLIISIRSLKATKGTSE